MPGRFDWWYRLRRVVGPPGAPASRAGVPSDIDAARLAELRPVFDHVDALEPELRARTEEGEHEADALRDAAEREVERTQADAQTRAAAARAHAATERQERHASEVDALIRQSEADAARIRERAEDLLPILVADAVAAVRTYARGHGEQASAATEGG